MTDCSQARAAIEARLAEVAPLVRGAHISAHLDECEACRSWEAERLAQHQRRRAQPESMGGPAHRTLRGRTLLLRYVLGVVAATEVVLGVGSLLGDVSLHPFRELAGADIAFAVGCLVAAIQPRRAIGVLPVALALAALIIGTGLLDLIRGVTGPLSESHHLLELIGAGTLALLARYLGATRDLV